MMRRLMWSTLFLILPVAAHATVVLPIEFRELVNIAPVIVHGRVVDIHAEYVDGRRAIETLVTIEAAEYLKGNLGDRVTFKVPGGELGSYRTIFVGAPEFREGDELVLFLKSSGDSIPSIIGLSQGAFRVVADARSGRRMVTTPILMGRSSGSAVPVVRGDVTRKPLPIESFRSAVLQVMASAQGGR
jgi:hypothetical protein